MFWKIVGAILFCLLGIPLIFLCIYTIFLGGMKNIFEMVEKFSDWLASKKRQKETPLVENPYNEIFQELQNNIHKINQKTEP